MEIKTYPWTSSKPAPTRPGITTEAWQSDPAGDVDAPVIEGDLDTAIEEAADAAAQIAELDALRQRAGQLEALQEKARRRSLKRQAAAQLAAQIEATKAALEAVAPKCEAWEQRFMALVAEAQKLYEELPAIQQEIFAAGKQLKRVAQSNDGLGHPVAANPTDPHYLTPDRFMDYWEQAGGLSERLFTIPVNPPRDTLLELLCSALHRRGRLVYWPGYTDPRAFDSRW